MSTARIFKAKINQPQFQLNFNHTIHLPHLFFLGRSCPRMRRQNATELIQLHLRFVVRTQLLRWNTTSFQFCEKYNDNDTMSWLAARAKRYIEFIVPPLKTVGILIERTPRTTQNPPTSQYKWMRLKINSNSSAHCDHFIHVVVYNSRATYHVTLSLCFGCHEIL